VNESEVKRAEQANWARVSQNLIVVGKHFLKLLALNLLKA